MSHVRTLGGVLRWCAAGAVALAALHAQAGIEGIWGGLPTTVQTERAFTLYTGEGHISMADGKQIYMWGFTDDVGKPMQFPGPTLKARVGETIRIRLINRLPVSTSLLFPGQVLTTGGAANNTANVLSNFAGAAGSVTGTGAANDTQVYEFVARQPGTYTYQSGTNPALQAEMGLVGTLIVYPADADGLTKAYNHPSTRFDRENLFVVSDLDSALHAQVDERLEQLRAAGAGCLTAPIPAAGCSGAIRVDMGKRFPDYWLLNGRTAPDVFAKNYVEELPLQPYNSLPRVHPGEKILLRMVGAGNDMHPMHHHGNNSWAIARDGRMLSNDPTGASGPNLAVSDFTIPVTPGQTYDAIWSWTGKGIGWDIFGAKCDAAQPVTVDNCRFGQYDANGTQTAGPATIPGSTDVFRSPQDPVTDMYRPIPVKLPSELELAFGEFYSGSPYLGDIGLRPVGAGAANNTGAFFHIFHSHNEREIVNGGVFIGGMMTMLVIEPFGVTID